MTAPLHLIKLCVGADTVDDLIAWQMIRMAERQAAGHDPRPRHITRMWPRRSDEILAGGSLYWVFRGSVLARQPILDLQEMVGADGIRRCGIVMDPRVVLVQARPRRPFQGWRYLEAKDAPPDLAGQGKGAKGLPADLARALDGLGVVRR